MLLTDSFSADLLRERIEGHVAIPGDADYDAARACWNLTHDLHPAVIVQAACAEDVREAVLFAREQGLRVLVQGTGHNGTGFGDAEDVVLVRMSAMCRLRIDAEHRIARIEAGAQWSDVTVPASEHGLAALSGSAPTGAASRSSSGLRGGGGAHAAIVGLELELILLPAVTGGMMLFGWERAGEVLEAWRAFTADAPETVTTSCRIMQIPDLPTLPEFVRGRGVVIIDGAVIGAAEQAAAVLAPLRALGPEVDTFADVPPVALSYIHMDPEDPMPAMSTSAMLDTLPAEAAAAIVDGFGEGSGSPLMMVELRHVGGALRRPGTSALSHLDAEYLLFAGGLSVGPELDIHTEQAFARLQATLAPWVNDRAYANFAERVHTPEELLGAEAATRLRAVRATYDPDGVFIGAQTR